MPVTSVSLANLVPSPVSAFQRNEIAIGLRRVCTQSELYWNAMPEEEFVAPLGASWSPADHVRHLTKSMRAVSNGMRVPKVLLWVAFGRTTRVSFRYDSLVARYHRALQQGGGAGRYAPRMQRVAGDVSEYRREVLQGHRDEVMRLADRALTWTAALALLLPLGLPVFRKLLDMAGGMRDGRQLKAVIPGGSSMPVRPSCAEAGRR